MRRRKKYDLYIVLVLLTVTIAYFVHSNLSAENRGINSYTSALEIYKASDYEKAYQEFGQVPSQSSLKSSALFRQARCATNMGKPELAIKKYKRIVNSNSKSAIIPISQYNMASLMFKTNRKQAAKVFKKIIKKYPTSDYATASEYYLGLIEIAELPNSGKRLEKAKEKAFIHFVNYISNAPDGRYALNSIEEIKKLNIHLSNYDNLLIAQSYYQCGEYEKAKEYLNKTTLTESWSDFAKTEYKLGNKDKTIYYTEKGLKEHSFNTKAEIVNEVIDNYISLFPTRKEGIVRLNDLGVKDTGADYISYLNCKDAMEETLKESCYSTLYEKYPNGQFSADALFNVFISKYLHKKYYDAQRLGYLHFKKFPNAKSSPAITYYMGKIAYKLKHYESANNYFKQVIKSYPDSYYAYRANYNLYKEDGSLPFLELHDKPVVFPYTKSLDNNLVVKLAYLKDYDLVSELCKKDKFIQSWLAYQRGDYTISTVLARNAMEELQIKPAFNDLRWRLVYPTHYYSTVEKVKGRNNPIILEAIIKEESHFNPKAKSCVGAIGLMQLMPSTYDEVVKKHNLPSDLEQETSNIMAGSLYYEGLKKVLGNKDLYAISAYNGGIGSVTNWLSKLIYNDTDEFVEQIPYQETKNYVKKVLRTYWMYGNIY